MWQGWRSQDGRRVGSWGPGPSWLGPWSCWAPGVCVSPGRMVLIFPPWVSAGGQHGVLVVWYETEGRMGGMWVWSLEWGGVQGRLRGGQQMVVTREGASERWTARSSPYPGLPLRVPPLLLWLCLAACRILGRWPGPDPCPTSRSPES